MAAEGVALDVVEAQEAAAVAPTGAILLLEHLNLTYVDRTATETFFFDGLGLTRDPTRPVDGSTIWANLGTQQFHLVAGEQATVVHGRIGLAVPDLEACAERLRRLAAHPWPEGCTLFEAPEPAATPPAVLACRCPSGNRFLLYSVTASVGPAATDEGALARPTKLAKAHLAASRSMGVRGSPGIRFLEVYVAPGCAKRISDVYRSTFSSPVFAARSGRTVVAFGAGSALVLTEAAPEHDAAAAAAMVPPSPTAPHARAAC